MNLPLLSIVIVSFNTRDLLGRCLASVVHSPYHLLVASILDEEPTLEVAPAGYAVEGKMSCEVIVVDNASLDGSAKMVLNEYPGVRVLDAGENLGFARATNWGLREARGDLLLLLNPDTEVVGDSLAQLAGFLLKGGPQLAAVSPALLYPDGRAQHAAFRFPTLWMSLFDFFPLHHRVVDSRLNGRYQVPGDGRPFPIDHPLGAAMMIRRDALDVVGLLDEEFFMYCEEVDWCLRAARAGWSIYQLPTAKIVHHGGQSSGQLREAMLVELHRSRYRLFRKHYSPAFVRTHRAITRLGLAREWLRAKRRGWRGLMSQDELGRRLAAYRTIWSM